MQIHQVFRMGTGASHHPHTPQPMHRCEQPLHRCEQPLHRYEQALHRYEQPLHRYEQPLRILSPVDMYFIVGRYVHVLSHELRAWNV